MGFGLLLFGYAFAFVLSLSPYPYVLALIGYAIMLEAFIKLGRYNARFIRCIYLLIPMLLCSAYTAVGEISAMISPENLVIFSAGVKDAVMYIELALVVAFNILLALALRSIAKDVGIEKIQSKSFTLIFAVSVYTVTALALHVFMDPQSEVGVVFTYASYIIRFIWAVIGIVTLFDCYRTICDEGDADMPLKRSRIPFINKMNEAAEKHEAEAAERNRKYVEEKIKKQNNKKNNKKKH